MTIRTAPKPQQGITLVELLMSMTIAVIVLTVGVSGMTTLAKRHARAVEVNALVGHLNFARAQAIMRALNIRVCPIVPGHAHEGCSATPSDDAWSHGYAVVALDAAGRMTSVLRVQQQARAMAIVGNRPCFEFEDDGTLQMGGCSGPGSLRVCDPNPNGIDPARVVISAMGRVRLEDTGVACAAG